MILSYISIISFSVACTILSPTPATRGDNVLSNILFFTLFRLVQILIIGSLQYLVIYYLCFILTLFLYFVYYLIILFSNIIFPITTSDLQNYYVQTFSLLMGAKRALELSLKIPPFIKFSQNYSITSSSSCHLHHVTCTMLSYSVLRL